MTGLIGGANIMQDADFKWFIEHMPKLYEEYGECYLAIKNKQVLGKYKTFSDGVKATSIAEPVGTFIIQRCGKDESAYTNYIASMNFM